MTEDLPFAYMGPPLKGKIRSNLEDFSVEEILHYEASGEGEHLFLHVNKVGINTKDVAKELARVAQVKLVDIGFAGLKDKNSTATQYFTIRFPHQRIINWESIDKEKIRILSIKRHNRKIRRGKLFGNYFKIILRDISGNRIEAESVAKKISLYGVPNYFGPQRFGKNSSNLHFAAHWLVDNKKRIKPEKKRMTISAAKSYIFNKVLAKRVKEGIWDQALRGDVFIIDGSEKQFIDNANYVSNIKRVIAREIHPSGPMPGSISRALKPDGDAAKIEAEIFCESQVSRWVEGLINVGALRERRALRLIPKNLSFKWLTNSSAQICFFLPRGSFGTSVVREIMSIK